MKTFKILLLSLTFSFQLQAQNYRKHLVFHLKPDGDMLKDSVSGRQWGPFTNTQLFPNRFGHQDAMFFKGGNGANNKVILENLKIKNLSKKGYTLVFWSGFQRADSANYSHAFVSKYLYPPNANEPCGGNMAIVRFRTYYYYNSIVSQCNFPIVDSVIQKRRLVPNRWAYQFISFDSISARLGINDTLWQLDGARLSNLDCTIPLTEPATAIDSINHIRLNVPFPLYVPFPNIPCPEPLDKLVDKFTFYDDVMIFDTAYGAADFETLRHFPDTATNIVSIKPFLSESYSHVYRYEKDNDRLMIMDNAPQNRIEQVQIVNLLGQVMYQNPTAVKEIAIGSFPPAVYLVRLRLKGGDLVVQKILKE